MIPNTRTFIQDLSDSGYTTSAIIPEALSHTNFVKIFSDVEFFNSFTTLYDGVGEKIINKIRTYLLNFVTHYYLSSKFFFHYKLPAHNKKYLQTKEGGLESAVIQSLTTEAPVNPNDARPTLSLPKKYLSSKHNNIKYK